MSAEDAPAANRRYLKTHNAMRGIAALAVFLYHIQLEPAYRLPLGWAETILSRGYVWVDFFFILSGYVLSLNYLRPLGQRRSGARSEEHTSELQSLMRISYAVFCLKK